MQFRHLLEWGQRHKLAAQSIDVDPPAPTRLFDFLGDFTVPGLEDEINMLHHKLKSSPGQQVSRFEYFEMVGHVKEQARFEAGIELVAAIGELMEKLPEHTEQTYAMPITTIITWWVTCALLSLLLASACSLVVVPTLI
eukprot:TRINITY_DN11801_c0_g1_i2.p1 TRINITY_DN11801_c0_g1~~TRINITY_DN11801_c0_g1_i2.p1  ORF type:complete len:139 (+),score=23.21 TRINITY_DN11801_c0_g1_i2:492-908(+)